MWKKVLSVLCIPVVLLLAISIPSTISSTLARMPDEGAGYKGGYLFGMVVSLVITVLVIFFLSRWIIRTLRPAEKPSDDPFPPVG
jgi:hypothetical protein